MKNHYDVLARNPDEFEFWYGNVRGWPPHSTSIGDAFQNNYQEAGRIEAIEDEKGLSRLAVEPLS